MAKPLWAGRFREGVDPAVQAFTASLPFDQRLWRHDLRGSLAHVRMLAATGILTRGEARRIEGGLLRIARALRSGRPAWDPKGEDVHLEIERWLTRLVGPVGGKLHTARSRNDQVALDLRLYLREVSLALAADTLGLAESFVKLGRRWPDPILPGYTHLQRAQPILLAHWALAHAGPLMRDAVRFRRAYEAADACPLGAGALAGVPYPIDRRLVARLLGFSALVPNSIDAVSDRDFAVEFLAACALLMTHLSRLAEDLVLWSTQEFGFVELPDAFSTGSSIMPQKKNPDLLELVRGKTGRTLGDLVRLLTVLKGIPLAYNRDLQEDKEAVFDAADTASGALAVVGALVPALTFRPEAMERAAGDAFLSATDLADYLTARGMPFREAHHLVGAVVRVCVDRGRALRDLSVAELRAFSPRFGSDVLAHLDPRGSAARRGSEGGTSPLQVRRQRGEVLARIGRERARLHSMVRRGRGRIPPL